MDNNGFKLERIEWIEHQGWGSDGWITRGDVEEWLEACPLRCFSVGWVIHEDDELVVLAASKNADDFAGITRIVKGAIRGRKGL